MNRIKGFLWPIATEELLKCGTSRYSIVKKQKYGLLDAEEVRSSHFQPQRGYLAAASLQQGGLSCEDLDLGEILIVSRNMLRKSVLPCCYVGNGLRQKQYVMNFCRRYASSIHNDPGLNRDFLVQLWVADKKMRKSKEKRKQITARSANDGKSVVDNLSSLQQSLGKWISSASVADEKSYDPEKLVLKQQPVLKQPPTSQRVIGPLKPASQHEAQVAPLLARSTLLITRDIEWANLMLGFEQENRYAIVDVFYPQSPVGLIREQSNLIARQLLRTRRPFVAYITDALGNELFRVRRPFWWINSSIYAEINGKEVGVVHRRWHLWKRIYDLYLGNEQFAVVENPGFWNWTFTLKDINGKVLAQIDRDWRGFGFEIFTDAGQYVIRFGSSDVGSKSGPASLTEELEVVRPLTLSERAVAVALAVSLDNDYFSRHGGWGMPFIAMEE